MPRKRTREQFVAEVESLVTEEYTVLGTYKNNSTKILIRHNTCGHEYEVIPNNFLRGRRCPNCKGERLRSAFVWSHGKFVSKVKEAVGKEYTVLGEYENSQTKILMKHNVCGFEYEVVPNSFLRGSRCPECQNKVRADKLTKTHEQFVAKVKEAVGNKYSVLGCYEKGSVKIRMRHNECGNEYEVAPSNFLGGSRCPKCFGTPRKNTEQFKQEVHNLVDDEYTVLGEYINTNTKILIRHNECGHEYDVEPHTFLAGNRCPSCRGGRISKSLAKTHGQFVSEVYEAVKDEYTVLEEYRNSSIKVLMRHNTCGFEYKVNPSSFLSGARCRKCSGLLKLTQEDFVARVHDLVGEEYTVLGTYKNSQTKILMRHNLCGRAYKVLPSNFLSGTRCLICCGYPRKTHKQFLQEVYDLVGEDYTVLGRYKNANTKIQMRHNVCGFEYMVAPHTFLNGRRCPGCHRSKGESTIDRILNENGFSFIPEFSLPGSRFEYDFAIFSGPIDDSSLRSINDNPVLLIEFDGIQHFEPVEAWGGIAGLEENQKRDKEKDSLAEKHNVPLLRIKYDRFNLDSKDGLNALRKFLLEEVNVALCSNGRGAKTQSC